MIPKLVGARRYIIIIKGSAYLYICMWKTPSVTCTEIQGHNIYDFNGHSITFPLAKNTSGR
jgi:hypothetical protein